jgi:hypothetical protein
MNIDMRVSFMSFVRVIFIRKDVYVISTYVWRKKYGVMLEKASKNEKIVKMS